MKKIIALLLVLVMILGVMAGCAKTAETPETPAETENTATETEQTTEADNTQEQPTEESTEIETPLHLTWQQGIGIDTLFESPHKDSQSLYPDMVFDSMITYDAAEDKLYPALATEWSVNDDYTVYTFTLREGVLWHDGEPFTADDVVWSIHDCVLNPNNGGMQFFQYIKGYDAAKEGTVDTLEGVSAEGNVVTIELTQPTARFLYSIGMTKILPYHLLGNVAWADVDSNEYWTKPIGTGAYKIDEVKFPDYFTCVRNDEYWGEPAGIKNVQFVSYQTGGSDAAVAAVITGNVDFATRQVVVDKSVADNITSQNADVKTIIMNDFVTRGFFFNTGVRADGNVKEDLKKKEVREALALLIDEDAIASFYNGQATASPTFVNPNATEYNTDIPTVSKDVEAAKKLLDDAGFDYSQVIDIAYYYNDQTSHDIMQLIVQDCAEAGVTVNPILLEGDLAALIYTDCNYDLLYAAANGAATDQAKPYNQFASNTSYTFMGMTEERGELFDALLDAYNASGDSEERKEIACQLQALNYEYCWGIPAYILNNCVCYNTANVQVPENVFAVGGTTNFRWNEWKMLK